MGEQHKFSRVAVLKGGPSAEREVSLRSGAAVAKGLRQAGYQVTEVNVTSHDLVLPDGTEAVFIALHGEFGEDGQIQSVLQGMRVPYTGSDPAASRRAFNKALTKEILTQRGIPTPCHQTMRRGGARTLGLPAVVKPVCQGSSIGTHRVLREEEWAAAFADALLYGEEVLVEEFIDGRELTVGIVGEAALPVIEIVAPDNWYDYKAKYTHGACQYLVPAPIPDAAAERCRDLAVRTFGALGCRGLARVDFRLDGRGPWVLELNSIPGFTETSLLPKAAAHFG